MALLAHERRRFGYRCIASLLRAADPQINGKHVCRLCKLVKLALRKRRGRQRLKFERASLHECRPIREVWSMDFVCRSLASGRCIKRLAITDDFRHECVTSLSIAESVPHILCACWGRWCCSAAIHRS